MRLLPPPRSSWNLHTPPNIFWKFWKWEEHGGRPFLICCSFTFLVVLKIIAAGFLEQSLVPRAAEKLRKRLRMDLYQKAVELDLGRYDNPEYYNEFVWSINEASGRMDKILADLRRFVNSATAVVVNGVFFLTLDRVGLLFVVGSPACDPCTPFPPGEAELFQRSGVEAPGEKKRLFQPHFLSQ